MSPTWLVYSVLLAGGGEEKSTPPRPKSTPVPLVWPHEEPAERFVPETPLSAADAKRIEADKRFAVGEMYARQERLSDAIRMFREALKEDPKHLESLRQAAPIAAQLDRREESLDLCRRALAIIGTDADLLYLQGVLLTAADDVDGALAALEKACKLPWLAEEKPSRYVNVREVLVDLYQRKGDETGLARAIGELIEVIENPDRYEIEPPLRRQLEQSRLGLYLRRAEALRKGKQFAAAVAVLEDLGKRDPRAGNQLKLELAQVHFDAGDFPAALRTVEQYLNALEAKSRSPYELLELTLIRLKRDKEVVERLEELSQRQPTNESLKRFLAQKLFDAGKYRRVEDLVSGSSGDRETQLLLLRTYQKLGDARKLLDVLTRLSSKQQADDDVGPLLEDLAKDKSLVKLIAHEAERLPRKNFSNLNAFFMMALLAREAGENDLATEFFKRCCDLAPQSKELRVDLLLALLQAERFAECLQASDSALVMAPNDIAITRLKAWSLVHLDRLPEGVKALQNLRGKVVGPDQLFQIEQMLGSVYVQAKEWSKAAETYRKLIEDHPDGLQALNCRYQLASVYSQMGDTKQAEVELLKIITANPGDQRLLASANNDLGYLWADEGKNLDRAEQMIRSALKAEKENAAYLDSLGWVLFKRGRFQEAKDYLKRAAAAKAGDDPVVWDHLGDALIQLGDKSGAAAAWGKAGDYFSKGLHGNPKEKAEGIRKKLEMVTGKAAAGVSGR